MEGMQLNLSESTTHWWERLAQRHAERKFSAEHPDTLKKTENIVRIFFESLVHRLFVFCWNKYKIFYAQQWAPLSTQELSEKRFSTPALSRISSISRGEFNDPQQTQDSAERALEESRNAQYDLERQVEALQQHITDLERQHDIAIAHQSSERHLHLEEKALLEGSLQECTLALHESRETQASLEESFRELQERAATLERELADATARVERAQAQQLDQPEVALPQVEDPRIESLSQQNSRLYNENRAQERELETLHQRTAQQEILLQRNLEETERMHLENQRITTALDRAEGQIIQMRGELAHFEELQTSYDHLSARYHEAEENLNRASSQQRAQETIQARLAREHYDLKTAHDLLNEECIALRRTLAALERHLEKTKESEQQLVQKLKDTEAVALANHDEQSTERCQLEEALTTQTEREKLLLEREQHCLTIEEENRGLREKIAVLVDRTVWKENANGDTVAAAIAPQRPGFSKPPMPKKSSPQKKQANY